MPQTPQDTKIEELKAELKEKVEEESKRKAETAKLQSDLNAKDAKIEKLKKESTQKDVKIKDLEKSLQSESDKLENMRAAEANRLKNSSSWPAAAEIYEALVRSKEKQVKATGDKAKATLLSKTLCSYQRNLGEAYMKSKDTLDKAEKYTQRSYDERMRLLDMEKGDSTLAYNARHARVQLCKIYRMSGDPAKLTDAEIILNEIWVRGQGNSGKNHDEVSFDAGYELACLLSEKNSDEKSRKKAADQFDDVWDARKANNATLMQLDPIATQWLLTLKTNQEKLPVLEKIWKERNIGNLSDRTLSQADQLALIYRDQKLYAKARPVFKELWSARDAPPRSCSSPVKRTCHVCTLPDTWFITGYRYADATLQTALNNDENWREARNVLCKLWEKRKEAPKKVVTARNISSYYLYTLLRLDEDAKRAELVGRTSWEESTAEFKSWKSDNTILQIGGRYADALETNGKLPEARHLGEEVWAGRKKLAFDAKDQPSVTAALFRGQALLRVIQNMGRTDYGTGWAKRCELLKDDIAKLDVLKEKK